MNKQKILILTAKYGNGHIQVAKTLEKRCMERGMDVIVCDLYQESHPLITEFTKYLYLKSFSFGKQFYRLFYYGVDKMYNKRVMNVYYTMGRKKLEQVIAAEKPDIIINTFPMIVVPEYRRRTGHVIPTFNVMTDFCLHKIWVHQNIDKYYVACEDVKEKLLSLGIDEKDVKVTGIPIRSRFEENIEIEPLYRKYGLSENKHILLIMAGAHGVLKNVKEICEAMRYSENVQTVVVCGNNHALKDRLAPLAKASRDQLKVLGYVERVDELFRIASLLITKPGGITLTEASSLSVPLVLYNPVPGQEKENAEFFAKHGAAVIVNNVSDMIDEVNKLLHSPNKLKRMRKNIFQLYHPNAVDTILDDIKLESERMSKYIHEHIS